MKYLVADRIQQRLVRKFLDFKATGSIGVAPEPTLLAFEMDPVYTCGRRQIGRLTQQEIDFYKTGERNGQTSEFHETMRGGHVTFHGPGQLVMYPIIDLRVAGLKVRDYICQVEGSIIELLETKYNLPAKRTAETGVWLDENRKIASIGVHVRRSVTSHGLGLNVCMDPYWFDRIVACNLPNARLVSINDYTPADVTTVSRQLAEILSRRLGFSLKERPASDLFNFVE